MAAACRTSAQAIYDLPTRRCSLLTFEAALLAPRWPDFAAGLEVLAHDITTEWVDELPNESES